MELIKTTRTTVTADPITDFFGTPHQYLVRKHSECQFALFCEKLVVIYMEGWPKFESSTDDLPEAIALIESDEDLGHVFTNVFVLLEGADGSKHTHMDVFSAAGEFELAYELDDNEEFFGFMGARRCESDETLEVKP